MKPLYIIAGVVVVGLLVWLYMRPRQSVQLPGLSLSRTI